MNNNIPYSPSRLEFTNLFHEKLRKYFRGRNTILDIGCGKLFFYNLLKDNNIKTTYTGIDTDPSRIENQKKSTKDKIIKKDLLKFESKKSTILQPAFGY